MFTQGKSGVSRSKYCNSAMPLLASAAASQPAATARMAASRPEARAGHASSSTAATAMPARYGSVAATGPEVKGQSQGSATSPAQKRLNGMASIVPSLLLRPAWANERRRLH